MVKVEESVKRKEEKLMNKDKEKEIKGLAKKFFKFPIRVSFNKDNDDLEFSLFDSNIGFMRFKNGKTDNINFWIYNQKYFDRALKLSEEFEKNYNSDVRLIKNYFL